MANKFRFEITNEVILTDDGITVIEMKNDADEYPGYDYYVWKPRFPMFHSHGTLADDRHTTEDIITLYENGYFDVVIENDLI